jgi:ribosomal protein S1
LLESPPGSGKGAAGELQPHADPVLPERERGPRLVPVEGVSAQLAGDDSLRELVDLAIQAVDATRKSTGMGVDAVWEAIRRARDAGDPVVGRIALTLEAGAFMYLGNGLYGFAPRQDLPSWVPRWPHRNAVGRQLEGIVTGIDEQAGTVFLSPRLAALRAARERAGQSRRVTARIVSASVSGLVVDLGGGRGFAPRRELDLDWLLEGPLPGSRWRGYVVEMGDAIVRLSAFAPGTRARRASRRERALTALSCGMILSGRVIAAGSGGALVAFGDGLVTGLVPAPALRSRLGTQVRPDRELSFRVVGRPSDPEDREVDVHLWPLPGAARLHPRA